MLFAMVRLVLLVKPLALIAVIAPVLVMATKTAKAIVEMIV